MTISKPYTLEIDDICKKHRNTRISKMHGSLKTKGVRWGFVAYKRKYSFPRSNRHKSLAYSIFEHASKDPGVKIEN